MRVTISVFGDNIPDISVEEEYEKHAIFMPDFDRATIISAVNTLLRAYGEAEIGEPDYQGAEEG